MTKIKLKPQDFEKEFKQKKLDKKAEARRRIEDIEIQRRIDRGLEC